MEHGDAVTNRYVFNSKEPMDPEQYWSFFERSGLAKLFQSRSIRNLPDYVFGVEVGLDSNGRKNRGGHIMEDTVEIFIEELCKKKSFSYLKEATSSKLKSEWGYDVPVDKSKRRYDFAINTGTEVILVETNFYKSGGSKLKSTAGEYRNLFDVLGGRFKFVWVTDGAGWGKEALPLQETFSHNDYVFNLSMLEEGILDSVI